MVHFGNDWDDILKDEFKKEYYLELRQFLKNEYMRTVVYPDMYDIFNALKSTAYSDVKAVILGQDPYHEPGQAHGLCFSVKEGIDPPPSLVNIFRELKSDLGIDPPPHGCLQQWADRGVLLLNSVLTVRAGKAGSHRNRGWEIFTDRVISLLGQREKPMVFILWGNYARSKKQLVDQSRHLVIESVHPSPLSASRGFFGGRYFSRTNEFLDEPIDWKIY